MPAAANFWNVLVNKFSVKVTIMSNFEINTANIETSARTGSARATVKVKGYWSSDTITLYLRRGYVGSKEWLVEISHSSGGRDSKEVACDLEAETYYGEALIALAQYGRELQKRFPEFEAQYQEYIAELRAESERAAAERDARIAADTAVGELLAKKLADSLTFGGAIKARVRGWTDTYHQVTFTKSLRGRTIFRVGGDVTSKKAFISKLAEMSLASIENVA